MTPIPLTILLLVAPPPLLVAALGSPSYGLREAATRELAVRLGCDDGVRWALYAGLGSPDAEVRWRCRGLIWRAWPCGRCKRTGGVAGLPWEPGYCREDGTRACPDCGGAGVDGRVLREIGGQGR